MNAQLYIQVSDRNGITYLKDCYVTPPFKIANISEDKSAVCLQLMMMCSSPGILDLDVYDIKVSLDENCQLQLHTQSYQRLFQMQYGARQQMEIRLQNGASFIYLPHPAVPHANSIFSAINKIYLQQNSNLIWGEILTCGRQLKDELFTFSKYHNLTEIYIDDKLVVKENLLMQPAVTDVKAIGQLEGFTHQASLLCISEFKSLPDTMNAVYDYLGLQADIIFGMTKAPCKGFIIRILGYKAEQLHNCLKYIAGMIEVNQNLIT